MTRPTPSPSRSGVSGGSGSVGADTGLNDAQSQLAAFSFGGPSSRLPLQNQTTGHSSFAGAAMTDIGEIQSGFKFGTCQPSDTDIDAGVGAGTDTAARLQSYQVASPSPTSSPSYSRPSPIADGTITRRDLSPHSSSRSAESQTTASTSEYPSLAQGQLASTPTIEYGAFEYPTLIPPSPTLDPSAGASLGTGPHASRGGGAGLARGSRGSLETAYPLGESHRRNSIIGRPAANSGANMGYTGMGMGMGQGSGSSSTRHAAHANLNPSAHFYTSTTSFPAYSPVLGSGSGTGPNQSYTFGYASVAFNWSNDQPLNRRSNTCSTIQTVPAGGRRPSILHSATVTDADGVPMVQSHGSGDDEITSGREAKAGGLEASADERPGMVHMPLSSTSTSSASSSSSSSTLTIIPPTTSKASSLASPTSTSPVRTPTSATSPIPHAHPAVAAATISTSARPPRRTSLMFQPITLPSPIPPSLLARRGSLPHHGPSTGGSGSGSGGGTRADHMRASFSGLQTYGALRDVTSHRLYHRRESLVAVSSINSDKGGFAKGTSTSTRSAPVRSRPTSQGVTSGELERDGETGAEGTVQVRVGPGLAAVEGTPTNHPLSPLSSPPSTSSLSQRRSSVPHSLRSQYRSPSSLINAYTDQSGPSRRQSANRSGRTDVIEPTSVGGQIENENESENENGHGHVYRRHRYQSFDRAFRPAFTRNLSSSDESDESGLQSFAHQTVCSVQAGDTVGALTGNRHSNDDPTSSSNSAHTHTQGMDSSREAVYRHTHGRQHVSEPETEPEGEPEAEAGADTDEVESLPTPGLDLDPASPLDHAGVHDGVQVRRPSCVSDSDSGMGIAMGTTMGMGMRLGEEERPMLKEQSSDETVTGKEVGSDAARARGDAGLVAARAEL